MLQFFSFRKKRFGFPTHAPKPKSGNFSVRKINYFPRSRRAPRLESRLQAVPSDHRLLITGYCFPPRRQTVARYCFGYASRGVFWRGLSGAAPRLGLRKPATVFLPPLSVCSAPQIGNGPPRHPLGLMPNCVARQMVGGLWVYFPQLASAASSPVAAAPAPPPHPRRRTTGRFRSSCSPCSCPP
jgi:hypothetical protein